jgi:putative pyruvate formate lyase activating enzyme
MFVPAYRKLPISEIEQRAQEAIAALERCRVCPRNCEVDRLNNKHATCKTGRYALVGSYGPHFGEENCLRGWNGSGTIFFGLCNLRCVFCQNWDISQMKSGTEATPKMLASMMMALQNQGCHNINFVTPEHVVPQILEALPFAIQRGLNLPIVYNTSAYDSLESLKWMEGIVDIYMPDFKFFTVEHAKLYSKAADYGEVAKRTIKEMHRQVGDLVMDDRGLAQRGILIRHLVMPAGVADTAEVVHWIAAELGVQTYVNVMAQYYPIHKTDKHPEINRRIDQTEFLEAVQLAKAAGLQRLDQRSIDAEC